MPRRTQHSRRGGRRRGGSFKSFLSGANKFLKKSGLLSTLGQIGSQMALASMGQWLEFLGTQLGQWATVVVVVAVEL